MCPPAEKMGSEVIFRGQPPRATKCPPKMTSDPIFSADAGGGQIGVGEVIELEVRPAEVGLAEVGAGEDRAPQIRVAEGHLLQVGAMKRRVPKVRALEGTAEERHSAKAGADERRGPQVDQVHPGTV